MILSMSNQAFLFALAFVFGLFIAFCYDLIRIFRTIVSHNMFITNIEDLFYWLSVSFCLFLVMLNKNNGEIRTYIVLAAFIGMIIYLITLSKIVLLMGDFIINIFKKIFHVIFTVIMFPFKILGHIIEVPMGILKNKINNAKINSKKVLQNSKKYATIKRASFMKQLKIIKKKH